MTFLIALAAVVVGAAITAALTSAAYRAVQRAGTDRSVGALRCLQDQLERVNAPTAAAVATTADLLEDA